MAKKKQAEGKNEIEAVEVVNKATEQQTIPPSIAQLLQPYYYQLSNGGDVALAALNVDAVVRRLEVGYYPRNKQEYVLYVRIEELKDEIRNLSLGAGGIDEIKKYYDARMQDIKNAFSNESTKTVTVGGYYPRNRNTQFRVNREAYTVANVPPGDKDENWQRQEIARIAKYIMKQSVSERLLGKQWIAGDPFDISIDQELGNALAGITPKELPKKLAPNPKQTLGAFMLTPAWMVMPKVLMEILEQGVRNWVAPSQDKDEFVHGNHERMLEVVEAE